MKHLLVFVVLAAAALASCGKFTITPPLASPPSNISKQIWTGDSGGFTILWTTGDITAAPRATPKKTVLSELGRTVVDFHEMMTKQRADCDLVRQAKLQSVVGTIVSIQYDDSMRCTSGANGTGRGSVAIDLSHPKTPLALSKLFPTHELDALRSKASHFCKVVPKDLFSRFAFSELHANTVIVAVSLPPDCSESEIDLALNVPVALKQPLGLAAQRKAGFLRHDQGAVSGGEATTVNYHYRTSMQ
ncbi:MAG: hypothetical protein M3Z41_06180 [Candidatus Eremiobacteraeota bacterium]|nr:hypothetical protein [Candidatus Eremiobacteraeota bacterium]